MNLLQRNPILSKIVIYKGNANLPNQIGDWDVHRIKLFV